MHGLHINQAPSGRFYWVGSVPANLMDTRKPTQSDVMGGRVDFETGLAYVNRYYNSINEMLADAQIAGAKVCDKEGCACRKYF